MKAIEIGKLLRAGTTGFVFGCRVNQLEAPSFAALVSADLGNGVQVFGLITDIHIDDDGLIRQLVTTENSSPEVIADNRVNRNIPVEISVLAVGYIQNGQVSHLLPPRPPLSLDKVYLCGDSEIVAFTSPERFGYLRHILTNKDLPAAELIACHLKQAQAAHAGMGNSGWIQSASQELITLLRDDYPFLMNVLGAIADIDVRL
jgi:hypothetical protein